MGMLAAGYLENGLLSDAEEAGARAVERTNGRDVWALHTLLSCLQLSGRSSEGTSRGGGMSVRCVYICTCV